MVGKEKEYAPEKEVSDKKAELIVRFEELIAHPENLGDEQEADDYVKILEELDINDLEARHILEDSKINAKISNIYNALLSTFKFIPSEK